MRARRPAMTNLGQYCWQIAAVSTARAHGFRRLIRKPLLYYVNRCLKPRLTHSTHSSRSADAPKKSFPGMEGQKSLHETQFSEKLPTHKALLSSSMLQSHTLALSTLGVAGRCSQGQLQQDTLQKGTGGQAEIK